MQDYFFDSSALVKNYANETGSSWISNIVDANAGNFIYVASITEVEVSTALCRKQRDAVITQSDLKMSIAKLHDDFINTYNVIDVDDVQITYAIRLVQSHPLRAYDAIQLATALQINEQITNLGLPTITFVSADVALNNAAVAEGLNVDDPNLHP
ncbi:MAG: type II toxin-antitoxin system VapC family toxin [Acidobacteriota bacterium]